MSCCDGYCCDCCDDDDGDEGLLTILSGLFGALFGLVWYGGWLVFLVWFLFSIWLFE